MCVFFKKKNNKKSYFSFIIFKMTMSMISVVEAITEVRVQIELPTIENLIFLRAHILKKSNLIIYFQQKKKTVTVKSLRNISVLVAYFID